MVIEIRAKIRQNTQRESTHSIQLQTENVEFGFVQRCMLIATVTISIQCALWRTISPTTQLGFYDFEVFSNAAITTRKYSFNTNEPFCITRYSVR